MIRLARPLALALVVALTTGCPAFFVDRGEIVAPTRDLARPAAKALPASSTFVDLQERWTREIRLGLGGHAVAVLKDPGLAAAEIAHEAALQDVRGAELETLITNRWTTYFGPEGDRFPIDVTWRFNEQFITKAAILDPASWNIELVTSSGKRFAPVATTVLSATPKPTGGCWQGAIRLWFPWRDPDSADAVIAGHTSWVALSLDHPSGSGDLTWRFRTLF